MRVAVMAMIGVIAVILVFTYVFILIAPSEIAQIRKYENENPYIETFELGFQDGKTETYNPQPGRWRPDYDEGYKLGVMTRYCNCSCGVRP